MNFLNIVQIGIRFLVFIADFYKKMIRGKEGGILCWDWGEGMGLEEYVALRCGARGQEFGERERWVERG